MNSKFWKLSQKVIAMTIVILICTTNVASAAFSFGGGSWREKMKESFSKIFSFGSWSPEELKAKFEEMKITGDFDINKIKECIGKLGDIDLKESLSGITDMFPDLSGMTGEGLNLNLDLSGLLGMLTGILGGSGESTLQGVTAEKITIKGETAQAFLGSAEALDLNASIYINTNASSDKWVILYHPFLYSGDKIANVLGQQYIDKGYNILAPNLRGFENGELIPDMNTLALGFLDGLDTYDWLCYLKGKGSKQVIIHGVSLGGATTLYASGIDEFMNNAPENIRMGKKLESLESLGLIGIVDDCGYTNMNQFEEMSPTTKPSTMAGVGLTSENYNYYSDAMNSIQYCKVPVLVIQGQADDMVSPDNGDRVISKINQLGGKVITFLPSDGAHAFILGGTHKDEYEAKVLELISLAEDGKVTTPYTPPTIEPEEVTVEEKAPTAETEPQQEGITQQTQMPEWLQPVVQGITNFFNKYR